MHFVLLSKFDFIRQESEKKIEKRFFHRPKKEKKRNFGQM